MRTEVVPHDNPSDEDPSPERLAELREQLRNHQAHLEQITSDIEAIKLKLHNEGTDKATEPLAS